MRNKINLIAYVDRLDGGDFAGLRRLLRGALHDVFGGIHLLPFFSPYDGADAGYDPDDHLTVDPRLGDWSDVSALAKDMDVTVDVILNHVSARSTPFKDVLENGAASPYAPLFLTFDRVFPNGASETDLASLQQPRAKLPFTLFEHATGERRLYWTTFSQNQIDIDVQSSAGQAYLQAILAKLAEAGVRMVRLDAAAYVIKRPKTSCFLIPETKAFLAETIGQAAALGLESLVEFHGHYEHQLELAHLGAWVYDFVLPPLLLHALFCGDARPLARWIDRRPSRSITVLDTHDGIGLFDAGPDSQGRPGLLTLEEIDAVKTEIGWRSRGESERASGRAAHNLDDAQVNCTFFDALGRRAQEMLIARAVQFFLPGVPHVYYVGLFGGSNDLDRLARTGVGRDINRRVYGHAQTKAALRTPFVRQLIRLIKLRNTHPAFAGEFGFDLFGSGDLRLAWSNKHHFAFLDIDFNARYARLCYDEGFEQQQILFEAVKGWSADHEKNAESSGKIAAPMAAGSELLSESTSSGWGGATP